MAPDQPARAALRRAIDRAGSLRALADAITASGGSSVSAQAVHHWLTKGVPAERAPQIERATAGAIRRYELRPDLYS